MSIETALETLNTLHTDMTAHVEAAAKCQDNHEFDPALEQLELAKTLYKSQMNQVHLEYPKGDPVITNAKIPLRTLFRQITDLQLQYTGEKNEYDKEQQRLMVEEQERKRLAEQEPELQDRADDSEELMHHQLHERIAQQQRDLIDEQQRLLAEIQPPQLNLNTTEQLAATFRQPNGSEPTTPVVKPQAFSIDTMDELDMHGELSPFDLPLSTSVDHIQQPSPRLFATHEGLITSDMKFAEAPPFLDRGHPNDQEDDNCNDPYFLQRFLRLSEVSSQLQAQTLLFVEQFKKAIPEMKNLDPKQQAITNLELLVISHKTFDLITDQGDFNHTEPEELQRSRQKQAYLELARTAQGKPSLAMQILGGMMLSISALVALAALTTGVVAAGTAAAVSLPLMAAGLGFFSLSRPSGLSKAMINIEAAVVEEEEEEEERWAHQSYV